MYTYFCKIQSSELYNKSRIIMTAVCPQIACLSLKRFCNLPSKSGCVRQMSALARSNCQAARTMPTTYAYSELSKVEYDMEPFENQSHEQNRSESELKAYLSSLNQHITSKRSARPKRPLSEGPEREFQPLYNYANLESTEIDQRPSYLKFLENLKDSNPELHEEITETLDVSELIDMSYLEIYANKSAPTILADGEYPDWIWNLVPESRQYWWTDLIQTPFENLSEMEQIRLMRKWKKTLHLSNKLWMQSTFGKTGKFRPGYKDPWPRPITKMDIWADTDVEYRRYAKHCVRKYNRKRKRIQEERVRSNDDYIQKHQISAEGKFQLRSASAVDENRDEHDHSHSRYYNQFGENDSSDLSETTHSEMDADRDGNYDDDKYALLSANDGRNDRRAAAEPEFEAIDLVKYYGMQNENLSIDDDNIDANVVYEVIARKSQ